MHSVLKKITDFATKAHGDQTRKYTPDPYIVHPIRVMKICEHFTNDITVLSAAILHDVLEDTPVTKEEMHSFLKSVMTEQEARKTLQLVVELTDVYIKKDYPQWNRRKRKSLEQDRMEKTSPDAQTIKYADIIDNCAEIINHDRSFGRVFLHECKTLLRRMTKGDPDLYHKAIETIDSNLKKLGVRENQANTKAS
jgi:(p)ppGpp synthase/HD superfamily hydrolase